MQAKNGTITVQRAEQSLKNNLPQGLTAQFAQMDIPYIPSAMAFEIRHYRGLQNSHSHLFQREPVLTTLLHQGSHTLR